MGREEAADVNGETLQIKTFRGRPRPEIETLVTKVDLTGEIILATDAFLLSKNNQRVACLISIRGIRGTKVCDSKHYIYIYIYIYIYQYVYILRTGRQLYPHYRRAFLWIQL